MYEESKKNLNMDNNFSRKILLLFCVFFLIILADKINFHYVNIRVRYIITDFFTFEMANSYIRTFMSFSIIGIIGYFFGGILSDKIGRNKVIGYSLPFLFLFYIFNLFLQNIYLFVYSYLMSCFIISFSLVSIYALFIDIIPRNFWATSLGILGGTMIFTHTISQYIVYFIYDAYLFRARASVLISIILILFFISFTIWFSTFRFNHDQLINKKNITYTEYDKNILDIIMLILISIFLINFTFHIINYLKNVQLHYFWAREKISIKKIGLIYTITMITGIFQILGGFLADKIGKKYMMIFNLFVIPFVASLIYIETYTQYIIIYPLIFLIFNISLPSYNSMIMDLSTRDKRSYLFGISLFTSSLTNWITIYLFGSYNENIISNTNLFAIPTIILCLSIPFIIKIKTRARTKF